MGLFDKIMPRRWKADAAPPKMQAAYMRKGTSGPFYFGLRPALRDPRQDIAAAYTAAAANAIDSLQNSGWLSGAVDAAIGQICGAGLKLNSRPDAEALGWTQEDADAWGKRVEARWAAWATDPVQCDIGGRMTVAMLQAAALKQWFATGDILTSISNLPRYGNPAGTKFGLIPSHRLDVAESAIDGVVQGVKLDAMGFPVGYRFKMERPESPGVEQFVDAPARDAFGRPVIVHVFDAQAGAVRGITPLAPALRVVRQFDQLSDATLTATLLQTIFAATIESDAPTEQVLQALQTTDEQAGAGLTTPSFDGFFDAREGWYSAQKVDLGQAGKIAHLFPGEKLNFNKVEDQSRVFEAFARFLLREVARCIGVTFEQLTGDYTGATYSSVRMAAADFWQLTVYRRVNIVSRLMQQIFEAWLEEQIDLGLIPLPAGAPMGYFLANRSALCRADWRGPPKPQADDQKAAAAQKTWREIGIVSDEMLCADLGVDYVDVYEQRAQEKKMRDQLGLVDAVPVAAGRPAAPAEDADGQDSEDQADQIEDDSNGGQDGD